MLAFSVLQKDFQTLALAYRSHDARHYCTHCALSSHPVYLLKTVNWASVETDWFNTFLYRVIYQVCSNHYSQDLLQKRTDCAGILNFKILNYIFGADVYILSCFHQSQCCKCIFLIHIHFQKHFIMNIIIRQYRYSCRRMSLILQVKFC